MNTQLIPPPGVTLDALMSDGEFILGKFTLSRVKNILKKKTIKEKNINENKKVFNHVLVFR